jgi:hypothetical protein
MNSIFLARALRDFGDGFIAILLPVYLTALGLSAFDVGLVATLALFGSALLTLGAGSGFLRPATACVGCCLPRRR